MNNNLNFTHEEKEMVEWWLQFDPTLAPRADDVDRAHFYLLLKGWDYMRREAYAYGRYCLWLPEGGGFVLLPQAAALHFQAYLDHERSCIHEPEREMVA
jgi:hypothetical protein